MIRRLTVLAVALLALGSAPAHGQEGAVEQWRRLYAEAMKANAEGRFVEELALWRKAVAAAKGFGEKDARYARTLGNLGKYPMMGAVVVVR